MFFQVAFLSADQDISKHAVETSGTVKPIPKKTPIKAINLPKSTQYNEQLRLQLDTSSGKAITISKKFLSGKFDKLLQQHHKFFGFVLPL